MAVHNPSEFDGNCPLCGKNPEFLDNTYQDGEKVLRYFCFNCQVNIYVNDETDEMEVIDH